MYVKENQKLKADKAELNRQVTELRKAFDNREIIHANVLNELQRYIGILQNDNDNITNLHNTRMANIKAKMDQLDIDLDKCIQQNIKQGVKIQDLYEMLKTRDDIIDRLNIIINDYMRIITK